MSTEDVMRIVGDVLAARDELLARNVSPGDVLVITGCALGVMLSGGGR